MHADNDSKGRIVKQPHTEQTYEHTDGEQNTGNHPKPGVPGADKLGGTRAGAENVEGGQTDKESSVERGTDVDRMPSLDGTMPGTKSDPSHERSPERDEFGRL